jgi:hypothetical protein
MCYYPYKFFKSDSAVIVMVVAKHILNNIIELVGVFIQDIHKGILDLFLLEDLIMVGIKLS